MAVSFSLQRLIDSARDQLPAFENDYTPHHTELAESITLVRALDAATSVHIEGLEKCITELTAIINQLAGDNTELTAIINVLTGQLSECLAPPATDPPALTLEEIKEIARNDS